MAKEMKYKVGDKVQVNCWSNSMERWIGVVTRVMPQQRSYDGYIGCYMVKFESPKEYKFPQVALERP